MQNSGNWSWIAGICSDGKFLTMLVSSFVNSEILQHYLSILKHGLTMRKDVESDSTILILDNASIHKAKSTLERLKDLQLNQCFIPPYSPSLALVKLFFKQIKTKFKSQKSWKHLKLDKSEERLELWKIILQLEGDPIKTTWKEIINNAFNTLKKNILK